MAVIVPGRTAEALLTPLIPGSPVGRSSCLGSDAPFLPASSAFPRASSAYHATRPPLRRDPPAPPPAPPTAQAGGWLGRVYLLDWGTAGVDRYVSLGSPHLPPPAGVVDQTRGILTACSDMCPGAYHSSVGRWVAHGSVGATRVGGSVGGTRVHL